MDYFRPEKKRNDYQETYRVSITYNYENKITLRTTARTIEDLAFMYIGTPIFFKFNLMFY